MQLISNWGFNAVGGWLGRFVRFGVKKGVFIESAKTPDSRMKVSQVVDSKGAKNSEQDFGPSNSLQKQVNPMKTKDQKIEPVSGFNLLGKIFPTEVTQMIENKDTKNSGPQIPPQVVENIGVNLLPSLQHQVVRKVWGNEFIVLNTNNYCMKLMELFPYKQCSSHRHVVKDETFLVIEGGMTLEVGDEKMFLGVGDRKRIKPGTWHRFKNFTPDKPCWFIEVSTYDSPKDVERRSESGSVSD